MAEPIRERDIIINPELDSVIARGHDGGKSLPTVSIHQKALFFNLKPARMKYFAGLHRSKSVLPRY